MPASASRLRPSDGTDLDQLLKNADLALYGAKGDGRRTYRFFEPGMDARAKARRTLELDLRQAIADGGFEIDYQPVVNLERQQDLRLRGAAALAASRTRHDLARGVHSGRGRDRPDQRTRRLGAGNGVRRGCQLAGGHPRRGQRLAGPVQEPDAGAQCRQRACRVRPCRHQAGARDHRGGADPRRRGGARQSASVRAGSACGSRWTISAPAIPR